MPRALTTRDDRAVRVALVAAGADIIGGHSVQARLLREALEREGIEVLDVPINPPWPALLRPLRRVPLLRTAINEVVYACTLLRLRRADVVHVFSASYWSFLLAPVPTMLLGRALGKRVVLHYHSGEAADHLDRWGWLVHPWLKLPHEIVVCSEFQRRAFARHGHRARVIPNVIGLERFEFRTRWPLRPRFLSNRNLGRGYGVDTILQAFAEIRARRPDATLVVAGGGPEEARLKALAAAQPGGGIEFVGQITNDRMPALLAACDVLLNASVIDNQPVSLIEAFAAGVVVVSTPAGAIPEMIEDRWSGLLVPTGSPHALAAAALSLLDQPGLAADMAARAHALADRFTWPSVRAGWWTVYGLPLEGHARTMRGGRLSAGPVPQFR